MFLIGTLLGGPAEILGLQTKAFRYNGPTLPDKWIFGAPLWAPFGWGMALSVIWIAASDLRRMLNLPENIVTQVGTTIAVSTVTILPGEYFFVRMGVWTWSDPSRLPLAGFSERLQVPLGTFAPPALMSVALARLTGARGA